MRWFEFLMDRGLLMDRGHSTTTTNEGHWFKYKTTDGTIVCSHLSLTREILPVHDGKK